MRALLSRFLADDSGATALEYGLIISLVFLVALAGITAFANAGTGTFNEAMGKLAAAIGAN
ncbi:Flp family type IVb pilin [Roseibacterium beibuensis]|uniref:Flp family type IVb pilin n=1 Tax=[Roseibacterium] beibuensis TaxID=1193142 RepID=UPI00217E729E|nr:Flp family type IVb pilin [Roseibacterium beibuensis]MCS6624638.1 Flp family type IVb pilin [Roseibacterium beibuensis]